MARIKPRTLALSLAALTLTAAITGSAPAHDEMLIGVNAAGQLKVHFHQSAAMRMPVSVIPEFPGWVAGGPGIESASESEPKEDFFILPNDVEIEVILAAIDEPLHLLNSTGSGFVPLGGSYVVLTPFFHWHCFWNLDPEGQYGVVYQAQLQFFDKSGQFTPSDPVTVELVAQCPGDADLSTVVDVGDLLAVINQWGPCPGGCSDLCGADQDQTCVVDVADLLIVITNWGQCVR